MRMLPADPYSNTALSNSVVAMTARPAPLRSLHVFNPSNAAAYVQLFDALTTGVTLGTTVPTLAFGVASGVHQSIPLPPEGINFRVGIALAGTTTGTGSSAPSSALVVAASYGG